MNLKQLLVADVTPPVNMKNDFRIDGITVAIFVILFAVLACIIAWIQSKKEKMKTLEQAKKRNVSNDDIILTATYNFPYNFEITVTPKVDIIALQLRIDYLDRNNVILKTEYQSWGNMQKGITKKESISLIEENPSKIQNCDIRIHDGTIFLFD